MSLIGLLLVVGAGALVGWQYLNPRDDFGRERTYPVVSVGLIGVLAMGAFVPSYLRYREDTKLARVASELIGTSVKVHCQSFGQTFTQLDGDLGFVKFGADGVPEHQTSIKRDPCKALDNYMGSDKSDPSPDEIEAVHILTHESMHMSGITSEFEAECAAMQRDAKTAELFGATPMEGYALARSYWLTVYPDMPETYRSDQCKSGGSLDEHLPLAPWDPPPV